MNNTTDFHSTDPAEMRRIELWCAEHVFGREFCPSHHSLTCCGRGEPRFLCSASADYEVLIHVRENWPREQFRHFQRAFVSLGNEDPCHYEIGDYCRAACITKSENKP